MRINCGTDSPLWETSELLSFRTLYAIFLMNRRIISATVPVKQNVSPEILDESHKNSNYYFRMMHILYNFSDNEKI